MPQDSEDVAARRSTPPTPLLVAAAVTALEGLVLVAIAVLELAHADADRLVVGLSTAVGFVACGSLLLLCAQQLRRCRSWARAPVVLAQLITVMVGTSFWGGGTTVVAVALIGAAVVALVCVFHPRSIAALEHDG